MIFDSVLQAPAKLHQEQPKGRTEQSRAEHQGTRLMDHYEHDLSMTCFYFTPLCFAWIFY